MNKIDLMQNQISGAFAKAATTSTALAACTGNRGGAASKNASRTLYIVGEITGDEQDLFLNIIQDDRGITNFNGKKLTVGRNAAIIAASVEYDNVVKADNVGDFKVFAKHLEFSKAAPASIRNAELTFKDDEKPLLKQPVYVLHNANTTRSNDEKYFYPGDTRIIEADKNLVCDVKTPSGNTLDALQRHFVRLTLIVGETVSR